MNINRKKLPCQYHIGECCTIMSPKEAAVILAKCSKSHKIYGIRAEMLARNRWQLTWAFPIKEASASREGYDQTSISGSMEFAPEYPGCPYCGSHQLTVCSCGRISCTSQQAGQSICEWCGARGELGQFTGGTITANGDR